MAKQRTRVAGGKRRRAGGKHTAARAGSPPAANRIDQARAAGAGAAAAASPPTVVAIGASAGGLAAFSELLTKLPPHPNAAFIFVQHLSREHESAIPSLLSARTDLPVVQATDGIRVEPNRLYVMPPGVQMEIAEGRLSLAPRPHDRTQFNPIDFFLESVARWAQEQSVGVILSGTASDGAAGIRDIKAVGGITIAQTPQTAKYDGMPRAAIATGMVDLVLSPAEIADYLGQLSHHPYLARKDDDPAAAGSGPTEEQFGELFALLRRAGGIDFTQYKMPTLKRRLFRRMALHRLTDVGAYLHYVREHPPEATALYQDLLIHVTRFFRDPDSFRSLQAHALHEIAIAGTQEPIRIWVPGCASGEEAYSVAIALTEVAGEQRAARKVQIFATDVSERAIEQARNGTYPATISADVSPERLKRFFTRVDGGFRVSKTLRDMCIFARHDLTRDPPFSRLDLIICRNVLIYLDTPLQKRLISLFHYALKPRGFLMLGAAETTGPQATFAIADKKWRLYRKAPPEPAVTFALPPERPLETPSRAAAGLAAFRPEGRTVQEEANRILLEKYGPPGVVVDSNFEIVHYRGRTGRYLETPAGEPSLNILKMVRGGLLHPLRSALNVARHKRRPVRKEGVAVQGEGGWGVVNLEVLPLVTSRGEYFLVLFETPPAPGTARPRVGKERGGRQAADTRVADLRRELAASREYLQSIIQELEAANEELQSANEEILSSNEELQSTNEELDTAKEELQSTNEELNTVNDELHSRNDELGRVNSDLVNLLGSVDLAVVIVGADMRIRRFTPASEPLFNLIAGDVGRPIGQIKPAFQHDDLERLIRPTVETAVVREHEVLGGNGRWYSLRIRPCKGPDGRFDGAVVTAIDIDDMRRYRRQSERYRESLMTMLECIGTPLLLLDEDLQVRKANRSFYETFHASRQLTEGRSILDLDSLQCDTSALRNLLAVAAAGKKADHLLVEPAGTTARRMRYLINACRVDIDDAQYSMLLAMETVDAEEAPS